MSDNLPAVSGTLVPGPGTVISAKDNRTHAFFNVIRDLLHSSHTFHSEDDLIAAVNSVNDFEKHMVDGSLSRVVNEGDRAPVEDVSQRIPPPTGAVVVPPAAGPAIDYNKLAQAIVAVQQQQQAPPPQTTDNSQANQEG